MPGCLLSLVLFLIVAGGQNTAVRVRPTTLPAIPHDIAVKLEAQGCLVPLVHTGQTYANVARGSFARKGQIDIAVLCVEGHHSRILVFWGRPTACSAAIDDRVSKRMEGAAVDADRVILAVNVRDVAAWSGPPEPGVMTHDGIEDMWAEKTAVVHYCEAGRWRVVARASS